MNPKLDLVKNTQEPPYPADTQANGYHPMINWQIIKVSKTWLLARPEIRPWLLMLWLESWNQIPAGSYPDDDEYIAAILGIDQEYFNGHRKTIMRGWVRYSDGRLYHPYITEQVLEMLENRRSSALRQRRFRDNKRIESESNALLTGDNALVTGQSHAEVEVEVEVENKKKYIFSKDVEKNSTADAVSSSTPPYTEILSLWAEILPELPQPVKLTDQRRDQIEALWRDEMNELADWEHCFRYIRESPFLMGRITPKNGYRVFRATLDWLIKPENITKLEEGRYHG
jgi:hypothetical protein